MNKNTLIKILMLLIIPLILIVIIYLYLKFFSIIIRIIESYSMFDKLVEIIFGEKNIEHIVNISALEWNIVCAIFMYYAGINILYSLSILLAFELYFYKKDKINLNLSRLLGITINNILEWYINRLIIIRKKTGILWIWFIIFMCIYFIFIDTLATYMFSENLDSIIKNHIYGLDNNIYESKVYTFIPSDMLFNSIQNGIMFLKINNILEIIAIIFLLLSLNIKSNSVKKMKNIYIWLIILALILLVLYIFI
jgi:hypothetical protein